jgi:hypothetical protein
MITGELERFFDERFGEIEEYLDLLQGIEAAAQSGPPRIQGANAHITAPQQKILYSSVYLQLYNLVEATVSRCLDAVSIAASEESRWRPEDLNSEMRSEWVRATARTHVDLSPGNRLKNAIFMCQHLMDSLPMKDFKIDIGGGGNWDDDAIERVGNRVGCKLRISAATRKAVKMSVRDELGSLKLVRKLRNDLAHGSISFTECADGVSASELRAVADAVGAYLRETIECFGSYVDMFDFLRPDRKPTGSAP